MPNDETRYINKVFMAGALPLMKVIATDDPLINKLYTLLRINAVYQVSAKTSGKGKEAVHFIVEDGVWEVHQGVYTGRKRISGELAFSSMEKMNAFMKGDFSQLPFFKIRSLPKFALFMMVLLKMSSVLTATEIPEDEKTQLLTIKCFFYLLSTGISALNKMGNPKVAEWVKKSPDRCYQFEVIGYPDLAAYLHVGNGQSKAGKGLYPRSDPFFTMAFDCPVSALMILMGKGDMFKMTANRQLIMKGGPEFGVQLSEYMFYIQELAM
ncbi:MAG: hypothetical protein II473_04160 [Clostridia bacterium]|nr:hypothetical protein [Clostridia bacterium]MBQ1895417.1 hypothetical protein [Clostridia bacterium]MBQ2092359.1 hypothetical protein [Clostridia bacterium]MBQ3897034.1 hypothetical protein [Clostridia bacterium]